MISSYLDIISVERAKKYLKLDDDTASADEQEIESMIKGAFRFLERVTNHIFVEREFTQLDIQGYYACLPTRVSVYNFPIISQNGDIPIQRWPLRSVYNYTPVTYVAGYASVTEVPDDFIQAALQMIKVWYYESEKEVNESLIPVSVKDVINTYRRFR